MKVKLFLHGHLKNKIQKDFVEIEAFNLYEALQQLAVNYQKELKAPLDVGRWKVKAKGYETKESWYVPLMDKEVHIYPSFNLSKKIGVQTIVGAVMVVVGVGSALLFGQGWGWTLAKYGAALMASGLLTDLFMKAPKVNTATEELTNSAYLGSQGNTTAIGTRIPFGYGLFKVAGHYISYNVTSTKVVEV